MDELETRMHAGLTQLAEPMAEVPNLNQVVARGRELRRRRRIAGIAGGAAAVLVVASGVGVVLGSGLLANGGRASVVATPSPAPSLSRTSAPGTSTKPALVVPGTTDQVVIDSGGLVNELMAAKVQVNATMLDDGRYMVGVDLQRGNRLDLTRAATNDGKSITWFQLTSKVVVGFVPHRLNWIQYIDKKADDPFFGSFSLDPVAFARFDATVVYRSAYTDGDFAGLSGYLWRDDAGRFCDGDGNALPTAIYEGATLYFSERFGIFGLVRGGSYTSGGEWRDDLYVVDSGDASTDKKAVEAVLLPVGSSQPTAELGVSGAQLDVTSLGDRVMLVATASVPDNTVALITSLSYTDANGKLVTHKG